ncbi:sulfotransferase family 2 domain-containing protein [Alteromonas oceanisediminis]|uniref:sulfotransferase family 2 domain-containing protein n=1 Tax=Alteromonas oceanisediminis TaxID=2836180 RepID=UPI001BDB20A7|nr:sulfotransferase family 2 domain-containing protein [Alteromonas oceanisediminis]MBT0587613.1 sulfotransferase family 2 domain-containing protein [Alteromonas oceanisediminis]
MSLVSSMTQTLKQKVLNHPKVAFIHVPKCAGVSVYDGIFKSLYPAYLKGTPLVTHIDLKGSKRAESLLSIDMMLARQINLVSFMHRKHSLFVTGHCYAAPQVVADFADWDFVTVLRNPVDRFISEYIYNTYKTSDWHTNTSNFEAYLDTEKALRSGTGYCRYFSGYAFEDILTQPDDAVVKAAIANLNRFAIVGQLEAMPVFSAQFEQRYTRSLKIPRANTSPNHRLADEIKHNRVYRDRIEALCERDTAIYQAMFKAAPHAQAV